MASPQIDDRTCILNFVSYSIPPRRYIPPNSPPPKIPQVNIRHPWKPLPASRPSCSPQFPHNRRCPPSFPRLQKMEQLDSPFYLLAISLLPFDPYRPSTHPTSFSSPTRSRRRRVVPSLQELTPSTEEFEGGVGSECDVFGGTYGTCYDVDFEGQEID